MVWSANVHTAMSSDTEPSIILTFPDAKYIFNASENTQRAFLRSNRAWRRTRGLFFTQSRVEQTGGLTGLIMTFADADIEKLSLLGPPGLKHIIASSRTYTYRNAIDISVGDIPWTTSTVATPQPCYSDTNITLYPISALPFDHNQPYDTTSSTETETTAPVPIIPDPSISESSAKRKREPSPDSPRKRRNSGGRAPGRTAFPPEFLLEVAQRDFDPSKLPTGMVDKYRDLILDAMFPNSKPRPAVATASGRRSRGSQPSPSIEATVNTDVDVDIDSQRKSRPPLPSGFHLQLPNYASDPPQTSSPGTMSYLVVGPQYRGKFDVAKAEALGVKGSNRGKLTRGETITIKVKVGDELVERVVKPEDVMDEAEKPGAVLILDTPSPAHARSLLATFRNSEFYSQAWDASGSPKKSSDFVLRAVYHICGDGVLEDEDFKTLMKGFGPDVNHIVASKDYCPDPVTFTNAAYSLLRLNLLDDKMFPLPKHSLASKKDISTVRDLPERTQIMSSGLHMELRPYSPPAMDPEFAAIDKFHPIILGHTPLELSPLMKKCIQRGKDRVQSTIRATLQDDAQEGTPFKEIVGKDIGVVALGTCGTVPSKYRNVLSTFIRIPDWGNILLDTGEGTWGQLARNYGLEEDGSYNAWQALRDLKCIFISHIHADHHMGLALLLAKRKMLDPPPQHPLFIVTIRTVHLYLRELSDVQDLGLFDPSGNGVVSVISESLRLTSPDGSAEGTWPIGGDEPWLDLETSMQNANRMCESLGLEYFRTSDMYHRCRCMGCNFKHKDGWSISFSGDTMPNQNMVRLGKDSTLLIHEATMGDDEIGQARAKAHSTISQAISIGRQMNATNTLLTHFSARYPKIPPSITREMTDASPGAGGIFAPAVDFANMTIGDMWKVAYYIPTMIRNFQEAGAADREKLVLSGSDMEKTPEVESRQAASG